jgi:hypothetical protein
MKVWDQNKSNCDLAYMASFWRKTNWSGKKEKRKRKKKEEVKRKLMVWKIKV